MANRRASTVVAQRRLLEAIRAMGMYGGIAVSDAMRASDAVRLGIEGVVRGASVVEASERWIDDGCMELTMAVSLADLRHAVPQLPYTQHMTPSTPIPFDDQASTRRGGSVRIAILDNDVIWDRRPVTPHVVHLPDHGTVIVDGDGTVVYRHDGGHATTDSFRYGLDDGAAITSTAVVTITIVPTASEAAPDGLGDPLDASHDTLGLPEAEAGGDPPAVDRDGDDAAAPIADSAALLNKARSAYRSALDYASLASPDDPYWRTAIAAAQDAATAAPASQEAALLLARALSLVGWHSRAFAAWEDYRSTVDGFPDQRVDPDDDPPSADLYVRTAAALGYSRIQAGDAAGALEYYHAILSVNPHDVGALTWAARLLFDLGRPEDALGYWVHVAEIAPDDPVARQYLERTRQRTAFGTTASDAFHAGASAYEAGLLDVALGHFEAAVRENDAFIDAWVWSGRTSLELGLPDRSRHHWDAVLVLDPSDQRARYFRDLAESQVRWGIPAADAFVAGQLARQQGQVQEAAELFVAATLMNDGYLAAWEWAARTYQEIGAYEEALVYWQALLKRAPDYERAEYHRNVAKQLVGRSVDAGRALADAITAYQNADFEAAEAHVREAIRADPEYPEAWGWLGRLHFVLASYEEAATGYEQAYALDPDNDDYRFFMEEAKWLATTRM